MAEMKMIARHTLKEGETLSHLALKYYGSSDKNKWMLIYEANKALIGDDPGKIRPGMQLNIPAEEQPGAAPTAAKMGKADRHIEE